MIMGSGTHVYEIAEGWAKLPGHIQFGYTHGIVVDASDNVFVFHTNKPCVVKFDKNGHYLSSWGDEFEGGAHGFYLHREGGSEFLYVTDADRGLMVKTTLDGEVLLTLGTPDLPDVYNQEHQYKPTDVAVASNGDIYVTDGYGQNYIHQYTAKGTYIRSWGGAGSGPGELSCPHGISIDLRSGEPEIYVADRGNHRFQVFTLEGEHKRFIVDDMDMPCSFYYYNDEVYFPDLHSRVTVFDRNDRLITHLGEDQQAYKQPGWPNLPNEYFRSNKFSSPHGVCVDSTGDVYAAEWTVNGRVTKLIRKR
ncbi:MAG: repeat-containing protein [Cohnella sp.]|nr:repeat-containing protein [Cohnella sp.]